MPLPERWFSCGALPEPDQSLPQLPVYTKRQCTKIRVSEKEEFFMRWNAGLVLIILNTMLLPEGQSAQNPVACYDLYELKLKAPQGVSEPFTSSNIQVDAEITRPDQKIDVVPCYYHAGQDWRLRYSPSIPGSHHIRVTCSLQGAQPAVIQEATFEAAASDLPGFIKVHPDNPHFFATAHNKTFYPVGENLAWIDPKRENYRTYFEKLSANHANWVRVWLCFWGLTELEWSSNQNHAYHGLKGYSLENAERIDQIFQAARDHGIFIQLVINHHGQYSTEVNPNWDSNPYNQANGGFLESPIQFFTHPEMKKRYKDRLRYLVARWGWTQNLFGWELWNEVNNTDALKKGTPAERQAVLDWHIEMARFLKALDPYDHLVTTSGCYIDESQGEDSTWNLPEFDYNQAHDYVSNIIGRIRSLAIQMRKYQKPFFNGEIGIHEIEWPAASEAIPLHDMLWTSLVSPQAGSAMTWYWDLNVDRHNLYSHFLPVAEIAAKIRWAEEDPLPMHADWTSQGVAPTELILEPGIGWGRSEVADIPVSPTLGGPAMGSISHYLQSAGKPDMRVNPVFHLAPSSPIRAAVILTGASRNGGSLLARLDGEVVGEIHLPPHDQKEDEIDLAKNRNRVDFDIPAGTHSLVLENPGTDWVKIKQVVFEEFADRLEVFAQGGKTQFLLWVRDRAYRSQVAQSWDAAMAIPRVEIELPELKLGTYSVTRWDTRTGQTSNLGPLEADSSGGRIILEKVDKDAFLLLERIDPDKR